MKQSTFSAVMANSIKNLLQGYSKTIRLLLVMLLTLTVTTNAWGADETATFIASSYGWNDAEKTGDPTTKTVDDITFEFAGGSTEPTYYDANGLRTYEGCEITISSEATISSIAFTYTISNSGSLSATPGTWNSSTKKWSGSANTVTFTVGHSSGTKNGQIRITQIAVTYTAAASDPYTVTLVPGSGTCDDESLTETSGGAGVTLPIATPSATCQSEGWTFAGWAEASVATETEEAPTTLYEAGDTYKPKSNITLYAVYQRTETTQGGGSSEETVDFSSQGYANQQEVSSYDGTNFSVVFDKGDNSNTPKYYTSGSAIRIYGGGYFTVSSDATITKIVLGFGSSDGSNAITTNVNTYSNGTWTGSANSVKFTIGGTSGNRRIKSLVVTTTGGGSSTTYYHSTPDCGASCTAPTNVAISGEYIHFPGEKLTLNVSGDNIVQDATYTWKKGGQVIAEQITATLTINSCEITDAGNYTCTVSNGDGCEATADFTVKMYSLRGLTDNNWSTDFVFAKDNATTATYSMELAGNSSYYFKVYDGSAYYGNTGDNPTMTSDNCTNWTMQENMGNNVKLQTTAAGIYTFTLDYTDASNPTISVTYPAKRIVYLNPEDVWAIDNPKFAVHAWHGSTAEDILMTKIDDCNNRNIYFAEIDAAHTHVIFIRGNKDSYDISNPWNNVWNQTGDLTIDNVQYNIGSEWDFSKASWTSFTPNYTVTLDANGHGTAPDAQCVAKNGKAETPDAPTATGYTFGGWYKEAGCTNVWDFANDVVTSDTTLYAKWTINTHTVTWKPAGGNWSGDTNDIVQTYEYDELIEAPEKPVRTGYEFVEWKPTYTADMTMPDKDLEFTAQWQINQYTVTLNPNYPNGKTGTFTYDAGELVDGNLVLTYDYSTASMTIEDLYTSLTLDGYEFGGWYNAKGVNPGEVSGSKCTTTGTITGNKTYFAKWSKLYSITLSENGTPTTPITQTSTSYTLPTELSVGICENDEKELVGWSTVAIPTPGDKPASNFYELGETVTLTADQTTFYAVFATVGEGGVDNTDYSNVHTSNVTLDNEGGTNATNSKVKISGVDYTAVKAGTGSAQGAVKITVPAGTTKLSFHMAGWNGEGNKTISLSGATADPSSFKSVADAGVSGNSTTYTLSGTIANYFYSTTLSNIDEETTLTFSNGGADQRFVIWGVNASTGGAISYSDYTTVCEAIPDPVWGGAEIDNATISVNCGETSPMNSAATISFPADKNNTLTYDITVTASNGFLLSTNKTNDAGYGESVTVSPVKTGTNAGTITQKVHVRAVAPAMSDVDFTGTITISGKQIATQTINVTADVTCTGYTLTLVDRGVSTLQPETYFAGQTIDEAPADPEGVCTDPIHYVFDGWAEATVAAGATTYTKVTFPYTVEGDTKFYAVYRYVEDGGADSGDYVKVTENLDDYSGDYLFVYETGNVAFDGGRNNVDDDLDATSNTIEVTINGNTIASNATTDAAKFTIAKVDGGYSIQSASGYYIGRSATSNGLSTNETYSANYDLNTITDCKTIKGKGGTILKYNKAADQKRFRYYQSGQEDIALYRKAASYLYTTSPVCGPHLVITEGKEIYVTGGNAGGTRDLVIAQQKVSYKATRLQTSNGLVDGTAPDVKVATNGITIGGVVTQDVKVTIDQTKEQQTDGTYTITGTITVQYQPSANNKQEDIQVQLAVDYNAEARDNFTVHARSLPAEFVIVAKSGDKWYALNGDMNTNAANPANGQVTLDNDDNPTEATYAPCNTIYTFDGLPNTGDRTYVRFQGTDGAWLWASSGTNVGIQNNVLKATPEGDNNAYNWKLYTENNITYRFGNANSSRQLTLSGEKFGMYASGVQDIRILPYVETCLYNYAPSNLKVSVLKGTYVTLTWDAVIGATKYQYSTNGTTWTDAGTEPTVTINGLEGNTEYTYYIRAYHEDAGVSQECIDYAEITFTTANCDDVPTDITYSADMNSIIVSWIANAATSIVNLYSDEEAEVLVATQSVASPCTFTDLAKNTQYYVQILADGTCASPIIPVKTEDVEVDIVEWDPQGIIVDINTDETIGVTLENEVSYGSGLGSLAEDLFFSKYFEGSGSLKMIAIYNGTGKDVDLSEYRIDRGSNGDATNISKTYDLSQLGIIKQGQEIIFYSWPLKSEYSYSCSQSFLDSKVQESGLDANPRWILCDAKTHNDIEFEAMDFSGNDPLLLYKSSELIDVFGVSTAQESPASTQICSGRSDEAWSADGVTNMDYGKTTEDFPNGEIPHGVNVDDETITAYTARVIMFRKNTVVSGKNAVTKNTTTFATFAEEWEARQVCMSGDDGDLTCAAYQELGTFDYSDYYTKYEPMGEGTTFDENARNADGTVTIEITDLYKHACSNIRVKLSNEGGEVLSDREYKVPIMITTTQGTDGQAFLDLQQNLATKEVDGEGNVIDTHPLTLDEVREICKTCDVVVRDNATLTKVTDGTTNDHPQVHDVIVYEGASIVIPDGTNHNYTINSLALRRKGDEVASAQVQGTGKFVLPADVPVTLSMRIDANNWHWFTLPYDCDIAKVTWSDGTPAKYNTDWFLMYYDGESRAASTNPYDNHWKVYSGTTIEAGKGYILGITGNLAHPNYTFELCFPMAQGVLTAEQTKKTVALNAWGVKSDNTPNNLGWNLVGNPYLDYYKTSENISFTGLSLLKYTGIDPVTGDRLYDDSGNVPFLVTPIDGGWYEYQQELASDVEMIPFTAYFVQVGDPANASHTDGMELHAEFESDHRGRMSLIRRAPQEVDGEQEPVIVRVEVTNAKGESDKTTLIIDDRFTNEYEMNGDFFKWFGDYYRRYTKPVLYSMGADQGKRAFNALNEELAAQPVALGMFAAQAGDYTFSLTRKRCDLSRVEEVWLYDATTATYTNLMQQDYTFTTAKTEGEGRFYLSVKMRQNAPTDITDIYGGNIVASAKDGQIIVGGLTDNTQLWIYDATGKLLHTEHTTNFQHVYDVPVVGTYFVRTQGAGQAQTIKVLVE